MSNVVVRTNEFSTIWPLLLDYNQRECLQILRRLELEAYSKIVAVLRAQGPLTEEKKKLLHKLQRLLSISIDRHKAEVRKALNDEELATISEAYVLLLSLLLLLLLLFTKGAVTKWLRHLTFSHRNSGLNPGPPSSV